MHNIENCISRIIDSTVIFNNILNWLIIKLKEKILSWVTHMIFKP